MRLGPIQKDIVAVLLRHEDGAYIGYGCIYDEFGGYICEEVEPALERLIRRGIVYKKDRICHALTVEARLMLAAGK